LSEGFWKDLQRRRVVRVAAAYVAAALAALEGAELVFPRLGLPDRALTVLVVVAALGFPAALILSWIFDVSPEGIVRADESAGAGRDRPGMPGRAMRLGLLGVVSVVFALGVWFWVPRAPGFGDVEADPNTLVVFPFEVRGSDEVAYLREGLVDLVSTSLDGVGGLSVLDPHVSLAQLGPDAEAGNGPDELARLAAGLGAGRALVGSVIWVGGTLQVGATVYGPGSDDRVEASVEGSAGELFPLVDELVADLVAGGVTDGSTQLSSLEGLTTRSNEALRLYLEGIQAFRLGRPWTDTFEPLTRAVEIDSTFALAAYWAGYVADYEAIEDPVPLYRLASRHQDRLPPRDRMRLTGALAGAEGRHADAIRSYEAFVGRYSDDLAGWFQLGEQLAHTGAFTARTDAEARAAYERVLQLDSAMAPVYYHLTVIAASQGDTTALEAWARRLESVGVDSLGVQLARMERALVVGDSAEARRHFEPARLSEGEIPPATLAGSWGQLMAATMTHAPEASWSLMSEFAERAISDTARAVAARNTARISAALGRFDEAQAALARPELPEAVVAQDRAWIALHPAASSRPRLEAAWAVLVGAKPPDGTGEEATRLYLLGRLALRLDHAEQLERSRAGLQSVAASDADGPLAGFVADLQAELEAYAAQARGDPTAALEHLLDASYWRQTHPWLAISSPTYLTGRIADRESMYLRAELLHEMGRDQDAAAWYATAAEGAWLRGPALLALSAIRRDQGQAESADALRARVERLWAGAGEEARGYLARAGRE